VARRRDWKDLQRSRHDPQPSLDGPSEYRWNRSLLLGKSVGADEVFGISQTFCSEVRFTVQLPSQESDWSSVEGEAAAIFIWSIERSRSYVFCPAPSPQKVYSL